MTLLWNSIAQFRVTAHILSTQSYKAWIFCAKRKSNVKPEKNRIICAKDSREITLLCKTFARNHNTVQLNCEKEKNIPRNLPYNARRLRYKRGFLENNSNLQQNNAEISQSYAK